MPGLNRRCSEGWVSMDINIAEKDFLKRILNA